MGMDVPTLSQSDEGRETQMGLGAGFESANRVGHRALMMHLGGTSLIRNSAPLAPYMYSRTMPRALWWFCLHIAHEKTPPTIGS